MLVGLVISTTSLQAFIQPAGKHPFPLLTHIQMHIDTIGFIYLMVCEIFSVSCQVNVYIGVCPNCSSHSKGPTAVHHL